MKFWDAVAEFEKDFLLKALIEHRWNMTQTAFAIEMPMRSLRLKMIQHNLRILRKEALSGWQPRINAGELP